MAKNFRVFVVVFATVGFVTGCSDLNGDVLRIEVWTLGPDSVERNLAGAEVRLDDPSEPARCVTPCEIEMPAAGAHYLFLYLPGWVQGPNPSMFVVEDDGSVTASVGPTSIVKMEGNVLCHRLERDLTGRWQDDIGGVVAYDVTMTNLGSYVSPPCIGSPEHDSCVQAGPWQSISGIYVEGERLIFCPGHPVECGGAWAEGSITDDGRTIEFDYTPPGGGEFQHFRYVKL